MYRDRALIVGIEKNAEREAAHRATETPEQFQARRRRHAEYLASQRAAETPELSQARRLQHETYMASQRDTETIEAAEYRKRAVAERALQRRLIFTKNTWRVFDKTAFEYDETLDYESHKLIKIEATNKNADFEVLLNGKRNLQALQNIDFCTVQSIAKLPTSFYRQHFAMFPLNRRYNLRNGVACEYYNFNRITTESNNNVLHF
ncbi:hypothetical protein TNCV_308801 [Trichonephila clavipes]|nr:hypothetical protein TNCV_308801 [Trichonephila clavipes]